MGTTNSCIGRNMTSTWSLQTMQQRLSRGDAPFGEAMYICQTVIDNFLNPPEYSSDAMAAFVRGFQLASQAVSSGKNITRERLGTAKTQLLKLKRIDPQVYAELDYLFNYSLVQGNPDYIVEIDTSTRGYDEIVAMAIAQDRGAVGHRLGDLLWFIEKYDLATETEKEEFC